MLPTSENPNLLQASVNTQHLYSARPCEQSQDATTKGDRQPLRGEISKQKPLPAPATHEDIVVAAEDVEVGNTSLLTYFSVNGEYTTNTLSEPRGCLVRASEGVGKIGHDGVREP
jgi:hypothetical protein